MRTSIILPGQELDSLPACCSDKRDVSTPGLRSNGLERSFVAGFPKSEGHRETNVRNPILSFLPSCRDPRGEGHLRPRPESFFRTPTTEGWSIDVHPRFRPHRGGSSEERRGVWRLRGTWRTNDTGKEGTNRRREKGFRSLQERRGVEGGRRVF